MEKYKTSVKDIPECNQKLIHEVAKMNKVSPAKAKDIMDFVGTYIGNVIKKGQMETVMIPNFGKFKPKQSLLKALHYSKINQPIQTTIFKILKGKNVKLENNDIIRDRPGDEPGENK